MLAFRRQPVLPVRRHHDKFSARVRPQRGAEAGAAGDQNRRTCQGLSVGISQRAFCRTRSHLRRQDARSQKEAEQEQNDSNSSANHRCMCQTAPFRENVLMQVGGIRAEFGENFC